MSFLNFKLHRKKFLGVLILILSLSCIYPTKANAQYVDILNAEKEYVADPIVYAITNNIIKRVTAQTVNWINSGFQGNPAYVTEPGQFFLDLADDEASRFLSGASMNSLCTPFKSQVRLAVVKNYLSESSSSQNYSCTLSRVKDNYDQFTQDFSVGGWEGWFEVTQNDSNNPYGAYLNAQSDLTKLLSKSKDEKQKQLDYGRGFLSFEQCPKGQTVTQDDVDSGNYGNLTRLMAGECRVKKQTVTPGSVIQEQLNDKLGSPGRRLEIGDEVDEILGALINQFINQLASGFGGSGLFGASQSGNGQSPLTDSLINDNDSTSPSNPNAGYVDMTPGSITCTTNSTTGVTTCNVTTGTAILCSASANSRGNDPGAPTTINPKDIVYKVTDLTSWSVNGNITGLLADPTNVHFDHSLPSTWVPFDVGKGSANTAFSSTWVLFWRLVPPPPVAPASIKAELAKLLISLTNLKLALNPTNTTNFPQVGDDDGGLLATNQVQAKQLRYERLLNDTTNNSGVEFTEESIRILAQDSSPKYPDVWKYISTEISNLQKETDAFMSIIANIRTNNKDERVSTNDFSKLKIQASKAIPRIDALFTKASELANPPPPGSGKWIAYPFDYLTPPKPNDVTIAGLFCNSEDFEPVADETYGFMLSTPAGNSSAADSSLNVKEKTPIFTYKWPPGITRPIPGNNSPIGVIGLPPGVPIGGMCNYNPGAGAPNEFGIVQSVAAAMPAELANSCQDSGGSSAFIDEVVRQLHAKDPRWGWNGKRGDVNNLSQDAIAYYAGSGTSVSTGDKNVYIIDMISNVCPGPANPSWSDVTAGTLQGGTTGAYVYPRTGGGSTSVGSFTGPGPTCTP